MLKLKHKRRNILLTEEDHQKLLDRFDVKKFRRGAKDSHYFINKIHCPLCKKYARGLPSCKECPFAPFKSAAPGCMKIISDMARGIAEKTGEDYYHLRHSISTPMEHVVFTDHYREQAERLLKAICDALKTAVPVKERKSNGKTAA